MKTTMTKIVIGICVGLAMVTVLSRCGAEDSTDSEDQESSGSKIQLPIIIWHFSGNRDTVSSLKLALSSGLINHVSIGGYHRKDPYLINKTRVDEAIKTVKKSKAKLIWIRSLWPFYDNKGITPDILFDPNYYIGEIQILQSEADKIGADFVGFDVEAYGKSPVRVYHKGQVKLSTQQRQRLKSVIEQVIEKVGKVDFIMPAGWKGNRMPYMTIATLGKNRTSEFVYYANYNRIKRYKAPYEIFGAYVNISRENELWPKLPYFLIPEIFDNSYLWSDKKGLWLYPKEKNAEAVAEKLVEYAAHLPRKKLVQREK